MKEAEVGGDGRLGGGADGGERREGGDRGRGAAAGSGIRWAWVGRLAAAGAKRLAARVGCRPRRGSRSC